MWSRLLPRTLPASVTSCLSLLCETGSEDRTSTVPDRYLTSPALITPFNTPWSTMPLCLLRSPLPMILCMLCLLFPASVTCVDDVSSICSEYHVEEVILTSCLTSCFVLLNGGIFVSVFCWAFRPSDSRPLLGQPSCHPETISVDIANKHSRSIPSALIAPPSQFLARTSFAWLCTSIVTPGLFFPGKAYTLI